MAIVSERRRPTALPKRLQILLVGGVIMGLLFVFLLLPGVGVNVRMGEYSLQAYQQDFSAYPPGSGFRPGLDYVSGKNGDYLSFRSRHRAWIWAFETGSTRWQSGRGASAVTGGGPR